MDKTLKISNPILKIFFIFIFGIFITINTYAVTVASLEIPIYKQRLIVGNDKVDKNLEINVDRSGPWHNETIALSKFMDSEYFGIIRIGSPAKEFKFIFDTTWADSWVASDHCGLYEIPCMVHTKYDSSKSSTYQEDGTPFETGKTSNDLRGFISKDNFVLSHMTLKNQSFAEMTHIPWFPYGVKKSDGVIGLGFPNLSLMKVPTFFTNMIKQGLLLQPVFTFYFNRDPTTERAGRLILGSTERSYVSGSLTAVPVIEKAYWKIKIDRIVLNGKTMSHPFCGKSCEAIFDSSTNIISGPRAEVERINELLGARSFLPPIFNMNRYLVNCREEFAKMAPIDFVIAGNTFTVHSKYYVQHLTYESVEICLSPFVPKDQNFWQLGGAFLMNFYTEYNYNTAQVMIGTTKY